MATEKRTTLTRLWRGSKLRHLALLAAATLGLVAVGGPYSLAGAAHAGRPVARHVARTLHLGITSSPIVDVSAACSGQNAEVEEATDPARNDVYEAWIGCGGIGFARSTDGGVRFDKAMTVPRSAGYSWDPAIAVAPNGTVYVSFMIGTGNSSFPAVAASFNHGVSFAQVSLLRPPFPGNWGDRDFIAVGPNGVVDVTWDYGPSAAAVKLLCNPAGSCAFKAGDLNAVIQRSTDGGRTWSQITPVGPGFPENGGDTAPVLIQPDGQVDVLYLGHEISNPITYPLHPGYEYFTSSADGGRTWPANPLRLFPAKGSVALSEWWIDGDLSRDSAGNLYATWDTQSASGDIGWLSYSTDQGATWASPVQVTPAGTHAVHIVEVAGGSPGVAYVAWQGDASRAGYATSLRVFSIEKGWLTPAISVSKHFGIASSWPGDTFGIATLPGKDSVRVVLSWGSAIGARSSSEIYASVTTISPAP